MVATYIGVALYIILYCGYSVYERFVLHRSTHFVPLREVDLVTDAVWGPGEGEEVRAGDHDMGKDVGHSEGARDRIWTWAKAL